MNNRVNFYLKPDTVNELDELSKAFGMSRSAWLTMKIRQEYNILQGDDEYQNTLSTLKEIQNLIMAMNEKIGK